MRRRSLLKDASEPKLGRLQTIRRRKNEELSIGNDFDGGSRSRTVFHTRFGVNLYGESASGLRVAQPGLRGPRVRQLRQDLAPDQG
jgi:hypothetical protein